MAGRVDERDRSHAKEPRGLMAAHLAVVDMPMPIKIVIDVAHLRLIVERVFAIWTVTHAAASSENCAFAPPRLVSGDHAFKSGEHLFASKICIDDSMAYV